MSVRETLSRNSPQRVIAQGLAFGFVSLIAASGAFLLYVAMNAQSLTSWAIWTIDRLWPFFGTFYGDLVGMVVATGPVVLAGVCYQTKRNQKKLNSVGVICSVLAFLGLGCGFIASLILKTNDPSLELVGSADTVRMLAQSAELSSRSSLVYLAVFFGFGGPENNA